MKINFRRLGRRPLLSIGVSEFHTTIFAVRIRQAAKAKPDVAESFRQPIALIRVNP
jgi:hypothetical protein